MVLDTLDQQRRQRVSFRDLTGKHLAGRDALRVGFVQQHHRPFARIGALVVGGACPASCHAQTLVM